MGFETQDVERKVIHILKVLNSSGQALGSRNIARNLKEYGIELGERAVRYHLRLMDERGLTRLAGRRDGRVITELGLSELKKARVSDKVGLAFSRIEKLAFQTSFDTEKRTGTVPVNISLFPKEKFNKALKYMKPFFQAGLCVSDLVIAADEGETVNEMVVPEGMSALATVCSILVNGMWLKAGIPVDSRFGGVLQMRNHIPLRFIELIHYSGSSLDPSEIFIRAGMTSVTRVNTDGNGEILANFREIPAICQPLAIEVIEKMKSVGLGGVLLMGNVHEQICEIPVDVDRVGVILIGGLNPVAAAQEAGIVSENHAMSVTVDYAKLVKFSEVLDERGQ
jgi:repressor of nif and glnA expression